MHKITENTKYRTVNWGFTVKSSCLKLFATLYIHIVRSYPLQVHEGNTSEVMDLFHKAPDMSERGQQAENKNTFSACTLFVH